VVVLGVVGCKSTKERPAKQDAPVVVAADAAVVADARELDAAPKKLFITGAGRCGECHEKMFDEWEVSAHAQAATSELYQLTRARAKDAACDRCHAPLAAAAADLVASEGVTCDVCHTLREPVPSKQGAQFRLAIDDMVKYGPRCDLADHYFHRMGCSPEHKQALVCGSCHWWEPNGLPVFTEFADWRDGPAAKAGVACQACHMPKEKAVIATGSPARTGVPHHGLLGLAADLRKRALAVQVAVRDDGGQVVVEVTLTNETAGHHVPAGLPERRIAVRARVRDRAGVELGSQLRELGRTLVDASGAEVPFWLATRVSADTRIAPRASWKDQLAFAAPGAGTVEVEVVYRGLSMAVAQQLGVEVEEQVLATAKVPFGAPTAGGRAKLPRTVTIKPRPPGKRPRGAGSP
jgi:hypothetical protein